MPRIAYLSKDSKEFYERLEKLMNIAARSLKIQYSDSNYLQTGLLQISTLKKTGWLATHTCGLILIQSKGILQVYAGPSVKIAYYLITIRKKFWILYIILFKKESMVHFKCGQTDF